MGPRILKALCGKSFSSESARSESDLTSRDYVTEYWPTKNTEGLKIKDMYDRIVLAKTQAPAKSPSATNGSKTQLLTGSSSATDGTELNGALNSGLGPNSEASLRTSATVKQE